ncbi:MAG: DUF1501 domain-containing protein [Bacteroidetes bacterium]|nr:MAG: DUF1501 domain-containing protein [Bacteroidota bacterium]
MNCDHQNNNYTRRDFLTRTSLGLGALSLGSFMDPMGLFGQSNMATVGTNSSGGVLGGPHFTPKVKRVIYLFQSGAPSQLDLFDYKPLLNKMNGEELPESIRQGQRLTGMTAGQASFPLAGTLFDFKKQGESGAWMSDLMPHTAKIVDELCFIKSMYTEAINHDPAITFIQSGSELPGRPSIGSWLSYGLGSDNENLPSFVVLITKDKFGQPLYSRLWGNGFLPSQHQGVQFRAGKDPVLYLNNPPGVSEESRREQLDHLQKLENINYHDVGDPEILARMAQYEMAFRMQTSVPEIMDTKSEPDHIYDSYGPDSRIPGTYAANCLLARRLAERDVKFIQLYHQGWDQHGNLPKAIKIQCEETDQATAALIMDLKQRGMLDDTLVIWGGEFGRTNYSQGQLTADNFGRDHHPRCFTIFMAGAGVKKGFTLGATDEFGYSIVQDPVHVHDFQATLMHLLGVDHERLTFKFQGRRYRLTDVHGKVVKSILS